MCRSRGGKTGDISLYLYIYRSAIRAWGRACLFLRRNVGMQISRKSLSRRQTTAPTLMLSGYNGTGGGDGCHSRLSASEWRMLKDENENSRRRFSDRCDLALATMAFRSRKQPIWHVQITEFPELSFSVAGSLLFAPPETLRFSRRLAPCGKPSDCRRRAKRKISTANVFIWIIIIIFAPARKIGRVIECAGLEIRYTLFVVSGV